MKFTATVTRDTRPSSPSYLASSPLLFYPNATSQDFAQDRLVSGQNVKNRARCDYCQSLRSRTIVFFPKMLRVTSILISRTLNDRIDPFPG